LHRFHPRRLAAPAALVAAVLIVAAWSARSPAAPVRDWSATAPSASAPGSGALRAGEIARVGRQAITVSQLDALLQQARATDARQGRAMPAAGTPAHAALVREALTVLVKQAEFAQRAEQMGIVVTAAEVKQQVDRLRQMLGGDERRYRTQLRTEGLTEPALEAQITAELLVEAINARLTYGTVVTAAEVKAYYDAHTAQFSRPATRAISEILVGTLALAERLHARLVAGASFASLAERYSTDPASAHEGGRLVVSRGDTVPAFDRVAFALPTGQLSAPVRTPYGWHLIKADGPITSGSTRPLAQAANEIHAELLQQRNTAIVRDWIARTTVAFAGKIRYAPGYPSR
jgi:parvulin-like peptidyl-prolyl isomerase